MDRLSRAEKLRATPMFDLSGKFALVTGATGGIGAAIARALHGQGATVGLNGRREGALESLASELGERVSCFPADLAVAEVARSLASDAESRMGQVDILVNNAGVTKDGLAMRMTDADWQQVLDVNLTAAFRLCRALLRGMIKRRWGRIITVTSVVGAVGNAGQANYAASKAGLTGFSKSLAVEVAARGITVNCISPGLIETDMTANLRENARTDWLSDIPAKRIGVPDDVASCAVFLASEEAGYVTGQTIHVNGGMARV